MKVRVGVSNRHIHLCREDVSVLFGEGYELHKRNDLSQEGEYASEETVKIRTEMGEFPHVRVVGPIRDYTQVEISKSDASVLGINPPMRDSGDLDNSCGLFITGPLGEIYKDNCCIIANRHIHCNKLDNIGHDNRDIVKVISNGKVMDNVHIKMGDNYKLEFHIDKDDALLYGLNNGDYIEIK